MKLTTWLCVTVGWALGVAGCSDSGKETAETDAVTTKAVAEALTGGVDFKDGLLKHGAIPKADADDVTISQDDPPLDLPPGGSALMSLSVENPDEDDDPVVATLIQFSGSDSHVEVPVGDGDAGVDAGAGDGTVETSFTLADDICQDFCNKKFPITMFQAIKLEGGKVSKQIKRTFTLDCREDGDADKCEKTAAGGKSGSAKDAGDGTGDPPEPAADAPSDALTSSMVAFDRASCVTCDSQSQAYCKTAPFPKLGVFCVAKVVDDNAKDSNVLGWANCVAAGLGTAAHTCMQSCDDVGCSPAAFDTASAACNELPAAAQTKVDKCMLVSDAGTAP